MAEDNEDGKINPPPPPSTPERAPWEDMRLLINRINRLIELYEAGAVAAPGAPGAPGPAGPPGAPAEPTEVVVTTPWKAREPEEIYRESLREVGTFYTPKMVDWSDGKRLVLKVHSTLNQAIQITVIGNIRNSPTGIVEIGPALACDAQNDISIGLAWDDWHPFVGCKIVVSTAPTSGELEIEAVVQE